MDLDKILGICPKSSIPSFDKWRFWWFWTKFAGQLKQINFVDSLAKRTQHTQNFTTLLGPPDCYRFVRISRFPGPRVSLPSSPHVASDLPVGDSSFHSAACTPVSFPPVSFLRPHQCISAPISSQPPPGTPGAPRSLRPTICSPCGPPRPLPGGRGRARPILISYQIPSWPGPTI